MMCVIVSLVRFCLGLSVNICFSPFVSFFPLLPLVTLNDLFIDWLINCSEVLVFVMCIHVYIIMLFWLVSCSCLCPITLALSSYILKKKKKGFKLLFGSEHFTWNVMTTNHRGPGVRREIRDICLAVFALTETCLQHSVFCLYCRGHVETACGPNRDLQNLWWTLQQCEQ